MKIPMHTSS